MEKKKAFLVVTGGRAVPNVLSLLWLQPHVVRVILSEQGWEYQQAFEDIAHSIPGCHIDIIPNVDAYNFDICLKACRNACSPYPDREWEWTFDITSAPKVTGIAAYEVAKEKGISCWHVDAQRDRHVSLVRPTEIDTTKFFHLTLDDYMRAQHRTWAIARGPTLNYRDVVKKWVNTAKALVTSSEAMELLKLLRDKKPSDVVSLPVHFASSSLLQLARSEGLLEVNKSHDGSMMCRFLSEEAARFMGTGDWLEFYVWHEAINKGLADEFHCQWGCSIFDGPVKKELDLTLMYKAQLILAECKTEQHPYDSKRGHLHKLQAKANVLGGSYVCKLFITNQQATGDSIQAFCQQAEQYKIVVVTGEKLPEIGQILEKEAMRPTYPRI